MAYYSNNRAAFTKYGPYSDIQIDSTADTALAGITTSSKISDVIAILNALVARKLVTTRTTTGKARANRTKGAIASLSGIVTITNGTASQTSASCTGRQTDATFTCNTNGSGALSAVNVTGGGTNHNVGNRIMFDFVGSGVGYATVATVS